MIVARYLLHRLIGSSYSTATESAGKVQIVWQIMCFADCFLEREHELVVTPSFFNTSMARLSTAAPCPRSRNFLSNSVGNRAGNTPPVFRL
jgi:hypothetical protein